MARILKYQPNAPAPDSDYPNSRIKNDTGTGNGTQVSEEIHGDIIQFFQKLLIDSGITTNDLPDNVTNGYQLLDAFLAKNRQYIAQNYDGTGAIGSVPSGEVRLGKNGKVKIDTNGSITAPQLLAILVSANNSVNDVSRFGAIHVGDVTGAEGTNTGGITSEKGITANDADIQAKNGNLKASGYTVSKNTTKIAAKISAGGGVISTKGSEVVTSLQVGSDIEVSITGNVPTDAIIIAQPVANSTGDDVHINVRTVSGVIHISMEDGTGATTIFRDFSIIAYW